MQEQEASGQNLDASSFKPTSSPLFGQDNLALRHRFLRTLCLLCDIIEPYNPGASASLFRDRQMGRTLPPPPASCAAHIESTGLYDPSDILTSGISIRGAYKPSLAPVTGGIYAPTVTTFVPFFREASWALRPQSNPLTNGIIFKHPAIIATAGEHRALYL